MNARCYLLMMLLVSSVMMQPMSTTRPLMRLSITKFKSVHEVMKDFPEYQPYIGLVMVEKEILKNLYTLSGYYEKTEAENMLRDSEKDAWTQEIEKYFNGDINTGTQNLVRQFFHMPLRANFNLSRAENNPVKILTPEHIGKILRVIHENVQKTHDAKGAVKKIDSMCAEVKAAVKKCLEEILGVIIVPKEWNQFLNAIEMSLKECSQENPNALFAKNTTQNILLGYMVCRCENEQDLAHYCRGFLGKDVAIKFDEYTKGELLNYAKEPSSVTDSVSFGNFVCGQLYEQLYKSGLPRIVAQNVGVTFEGNSFTDCVECVMRNLCNIVTYDGKKCGVCPDDLHMDDQLAHYYKTFGDNTKIVEKSAHQAWVVVVDNRENVVYNRVFDVTSKEVVSTLHNCDGFVPVATVDNSLPTKQISVGDKIYTLYEQKVGDLTLLLVPQSTGLHCCELMPLLRNVIVLMNDLFGMKLYQNSNLYRSHDLSGLKFDKKYFSKMCQKFDWRIVRESTQNKSVIVDLAKNDKYNFQINLMYKAHGSVSAQKTETAELVVPVGTTVVPAGTTKEQKSLVVGLGLANMSDFKDVFYTNLSDPNLRLDITKKMMESSTAAYAKVVNSLAISFAFQDDSHFQEELLNVKNKLYGLDALRIMVLLGIYKDGDSAKLITHSVELGLLGYKDKQLLLKLIVKGLGDSNDIDSGHYGKCIRVCIEKGIFGLEDKELLKTWIESKGLITGNEWGRFECWSCIYACINKGVFGLEDKELLKTWIESKGLDDRDELARSYCWSCINACINKDVFRVEDKELLKTWIEKELIAGKQWVLTNIQVCIEKGVFGVEDKELLKTWIAESKGLDDREWLVRYFCWKCIEVCIEKGVFGLKDKELLKAWIESKGLVDSDKSVRYNCWSCIEACINKGVFGPEDKSFLLDWIRKGPIDFGIDVEGLILRIERQLQANGLLQREDLGVQGGAFNPTRPALSPRFLGSDYDDYEEPRVVGVSPEQREENMRILQEYNRRIEREQMETDAQRLPKIQPKMQVEIPTTTGAQGGSSWWEQMKLRATKTAQRLRR